MSSSLFSDLSTRISKTALDGLSLRQQAISRNIANVDTPGYKAETVNFQEVLSRITDPGTVLPLSTTNDAHLLSVDGGATFGLAQRSGGTERADQNNVDIDVEMTDMSETGIQYQAISQAISKKLLLLKTLAK